MLPAKFAGAAWAVHSMAIARCPAEAVRPWEVLAARPDESASGEDVSCAQGSRGSTAARAAEPIPQLPAALHSRIFSPHGPACGARRAMKCAASRRASRTMQVPSARTGRVAARSAGTPKSAGARSTMQPHAQGRRQRILRAASVPLGIAHAEDSAARPGIPVPAAVL